MHTHERGRPGFARQAQPEAGLKDVPVEGGQPHPFHIDRRGGIIQYPSCRAVSPDIVGGVHQSLQLQPGLTGSVPFMGDASGMRRSASRYLS